MNKTAQCLCGDIAITLNSEPDFVVACHCTQCQRRTGSAFGLSAYFKESTLESTQGEASHYEITDEKGQMAKTSFCPNCGSTVYWQIDKMPGKIGVAGGCFADPTMLKTNNLETAAPADICPEPKVAVWTASKHPWVNIPDGWRVSENETF